MNLKLSIQLLMAVMDTKKEEQSLPDDSSDQSEDHTDELSVHTVDNGSLEIDGSGQICERKRHRDSDGDHPSKRACITARIAARKFMMTAPMGK